MCQNQKIELQVSILSETQLTVDESQPSEHKTIIAYYRWILMTFRLVKSNIITLLILL
jgi:hypothetical protein